MRFCVNCGKELLDNVKFCDSCGTAVTTEEKTVDKEILQTTSTVEDTGTENSADSNIKESEFLETETIVKPKKKFVFSKKILAIAGAALVLLIIAGVAIGNAVSLNKYEEKLETAYDTITRGAETAEEYSTLQSKVWSNCIHERASVETDKYTKNKNGWFYSDFNDALTSFYEGESFNYSMVNLNVTSVNLQMAELKDCPKKFEDEYKALKELYVAYSDITDLVVGNTSHSCNSFTEALNSAVSKYKSALSSARLLLD